MTDVIDLQLVGDAHLVATLEKLEPDTREALGRRMLEEMIFASGYIKEHKLHGQVLHARTGHLSQSVTYEVNEGPGFVEGWAGVPEGPTALYGAIHEYGWSGTVKAHLREITQAWGHELKEPHTIIVKAHTATYSERSFIRSSFEELALRITSRLQDAYEQAFSEALGTE